ncbi:MAG TPA: tRNA uridine-5-carboxymethylaminomethyl(34) synthesis GTPase MnmE [Candidatus Babeliales bacterium]|nr:tRNA uridine-5-carboxymethylaminomethyl(34) synthesis GTPase MnmE [Candidatus Babeliales bacterium]
MNIAHDEQTIIAQCTPKGTGALALLRISGTDAVGIADKISKLASGKPLYDQPTHTVHYGFVLDDQRKPIDQVMFIVMRAPRTFTGQHTVEITCHNNPFIIEAIIVQAIIAGARLAQEGEFTKRAVQNNKIDLLQAEAINELINANTQQALKQSLSQLEGSFSSWILNIEKDLIKAFAFTQASFEFIDEEMEFGPQIKLIILDVINTIGSIKRTFTQQQHIRQGFRIALIGAVNAGKSSLFNAILNKKRAIVTNIAGTTRDAIEAGIYKTNNYWTLVDTAGLRQTDDAIEQEGIIRSHAEAHQADIILLVVDQARAMIDQERMVYEDLINRYSHKIIVVLNKADIPSVLTHHLSLKASITVSSTSRNNIEELEHLIEEKIAHLLAQSDAPFLLNQRQYNLLIGLEQKLNNVLTMFEGIVEYEILAYHLNEAIAQLTELTGKTISEQGMDAVFREFCVGK